MRNVAMAGAPDVEDILAVKAACNNRSEQLGSPSEAACGLGWGQLSCGSHGTAVVTISKARRSFLDRAFQGS